MSDPRYIGGGLIDRIGAGRGRRLKAFRAYAAASIRLLVVVRIRTVIALVPLIVRIEMTSHDLLLKLGQHMLARVIVREDRFA